MANNMPLNEKKDSIILGSGYVYMTDYADGMEIPTDAELETAENNVGHIKGGAELVYTPTTYAVTNDFRYTIRKFITEEAVTFKSGLLTWMLKNLERLTPGVVSSNTGETEQTLKIGGGGQLKRHVLRFVHIKEGGLKLRVTLIASPDSGFTLTFQPAQETVVDAQFTALSQEDGTLVEIRDEIKVA